MHMVWLHLKLSIWPLRPDFWFRNAPLMRNADIVEEDELTDWNFYPDSWLEMTSLGSLQLKECIRLGPRGGRSSSKKVTDGCVDRKLTELSWWICKQNLALFSAQKWMKWHLFCEQLGPGHWDLDIWTHWTSKTWGQSLWLREVCLQADGWLGYWCPYRRDRHHRRGFRAGTGLADPILSCFGIFQLFFWTTKDLWRQIRIHQYVVSCRFCLPSKNICFYVYTIHNKRNIRGCALTHIIVARSFLHALAKQFW